MGCKNDCVFCNQRKITGVTDVMSIPDVNAHIESYLETMHFDQIEIAFYGGSFTGLDMDLQRDYLKVAKRFKDKGRIHRIRLSTRPDYITEEILEQLKYYEVDMVELGCQSFHDDVLLKSKRGHNRKAIFSAISMLKAYDFNFGIQLMYGLPGDSESKFLESVDESIKLRPNCVRIYPALVIKETELAELALSEHYTPITLEDAVAVVAEAYKRFTVNDIPVIRLGLQKTDLIELGADVIAGPFHPAFGALVMSFLFFEALSNYFNQYGYEEELEVVVNKSQASFISGQGKINWIKLKEIYGELNFRIISDDSIPIHTIKIISKNTTHSINVMR
jgi:histone acetyltransferase (RNA polymerase elongator complex component)